MVESLAGETVLGADRVLDVVSVLLLAVREAGIAPGLARAVLSLRVVECVTELVAQDLEQRRLEWLPVPVERDEGVVLEVGRSENCAVARQPVADRGGQTRPRSRSVTGPDAVL